MPRGMGSLFVVDSHPFSRDLPHLLHTSKQVEIADVSTIKTFDKGILCWLPRLNLINQDAGARPSLLEGSAPDTLALIHSQHGKVTRGQS